MAKILVVEDEPQLRQTYNIIISRQGHKVENAQDGQEALIKAESFQPDLILLDMLLPKMNGLDFLKHYDVKNRHPDVKIIILSNVSMPIDMEEASKLGVIKYMIKSSTSPKQLADIVSQVLSPSQNSNK